MQKKIYVGGLPWEIDRIGLLNYFKMMLEENDIAASYELPFITNPLVNPNSAVRVVDVFVALDKETNKSRGFGFITLEFLDEDGGEDMFNKLIEMMNGRVQIGIRGPRELIVKEADRQPGEENNAQNQDQGNSSSDDTFGL